MNPTASRSSQKTPAAIVGVPLLPAQMKVIP